MGVDSLRGCSATIFVAAVFSRQGTDIPIPDKTCQCSPFMKRFLMILLGTGMVLGESWIATSVILHVDKGLSFLKESGSIMVRLIKRFD